MVFDDCTFKCPFILRLTNERYVPDWNADKLPPPTMPSKSIV